MALQELDFTTSYIPGKENSISDAMSRLCIKNMEQKVKIVSAISVSQPLAAERYALIAKCRNTLVGHGGVQRTMCNLKVITDRWSGMRKNVKTFIKHCSLCQKMTQVKIPINAYRYTTSSYLPMECLNIDFIGPFSDKCYVLVIIDAFTRFVELVATVDSTAKEACRGLVQHIGRYGTPKYIRPDNGPSFESRIIDELLIMVGTNHSLTLAYSSQENAIVKRCNKEVNRHIRAYTYDRATTENYQEILPIVQRILNTTVNDRMKVSPAQILFGNALNLDRGILLPPDEIICPLTSMTASSSKMLQQQEALIRITRELLIESDRLHQAGESTDITEFAIDSFVLVAQRTQPPTRMHTLWRGPMRVVSIERAEYTLLDLISNKDKKYHMTQIKQFHFDPAQTDPIDISRRDYLEFFIEHIIEFRGDIKRYNSLEFKIKWLNFGEDRNTWEPWKNLRCTEKLHLFLISKNLKRLIPRQLHDIENHFLFFSRSFGSFSQ